MQNKKNYQRPTVEVLAIQLQQNFMGSLGGGEISGPGAEGGWG